MKSAVLGWIALLALGLVDSAGQEGVSKPIAIGILLPTDTSEAESIKQGALLAAAQVNQAGRLQIRPVFRGRPGQWGTEGDEAGALALDDEVSSMITPSDGTAAHQVLQVAGRTRIPVVSLCPDSSITGAGVPWAVRISARSDEEAQALFAGLKDPTRFLRWAALVPPDRAGREASRDLKSAAAAAGCQLQDPIVLSRDSQAFAAQIAPLLASPPDAILLWTTPAIAGRLARELRKAGFPGILTGPGRLCSPAFVDAAGKAADGVVVPSLVAPQGLQREWRAFREEYERQNLAAPDLAALLAHDAVLLLAHHFAEKPALKPLAFPPRQPLAAASGQLQFDGEGNRLVSLRLLVCRGGKFQRLSEAGAAGCVNTNGEEQQGLTSARRAPSP